MKFTTVFQTDAGIRKKTNQDSLCIKQAKTREGTVLMAVLCDGLGGLAKGEVASASLIKAFADWFDQDLIFALKEREPLEAVRLQWGDIIQQMNRKIGTYGKLNDLQLGSTVTAFLVLEDDRYLIAHVGDSRLYQISDWEIQQLTTDQSVVAHEIRLGHLTEKEAEDDPRRNILLQCVGASRVVEPQFIQGKIKQGECYMLCSDGFWRRLSQEEMLGGLAPCQNPDDRSLEAHLAALVECDKEREETDNISVIAIKVE